MAGVRKYHKASLYYVFILGSSITVCVRAIFFCNHMPKLTT